MPGLTATPIITPLRGGVSRAEPLASARRACPSEGAASEAKAMASGRARRRKKGMAGSERTSPRVGLHLADSRRGLGLQHQLEARMEAARGRIEIARLAVERDLGP